MHALLTLFAPSEFRHGYLERQKALASLLGAASELQALLDSDELDQALSKAIELGELGVRLGTMLDADRDQAPLLKEKENNKHELEARMLAQRLLNHLNGNIRLTMPETIAELTLWARNAVHKWATSRRLNVFRMRLFAACLVAVTLLSGVYLAVDYAIDLHSRKIERARLSQFDVDLASPRHIRPPHFVVGGLLFPETDGESHWCWGLGPRTLIAFVLHEPRQITVSGSLHNPIAGQVVTFNGNGTLQSLPFERSPTWPQADSVFTFTFNGVQGLNTLSIEFTDWNHKNSVFAPNDANQYAVAFQRLAITTSALKTNADQ